MKKKKVVLFSLVFVLGIPLTTFGKIDHGYSKGGHETLQKDGTYKLFSAYIKEDGSAARNEWIQRTSEGGVGVSIYEYYGDDGNIMSKTTTPDGYTVNYEGRWYKNCPGATINVTEGSRIEQYGAVFFPFSYDGNVVKNDYLGINLNYGEADYQEGFELDMDNYTCSSSYRAFIIKSPTKATATFSILPRDASTEEAHRAWVDDDYVKSWADTSLEEINVGGLNLRGYRLVHHTGGTTLRLSKAIPGGASWQIEFRFKNPEDEVQILNWLNSHMSITK